MVQTVKQSVGMGQSKYRFDIGNRHIVSYLQYIRILICQLLFGMIISYNNDYIDGMMMTRVNTN